MPKTSITSDSNGFFLKSKKINQKDMLHSTDSPALIHPDGREEYFVEGKHNRFAGPSIIDKHGVVLYYDEGDLHRKGAPAIIHPDGGEEWYEYGYRHRLDGPAVSLKGEKEEFHYRGYRFGTLELLQLKAKEFRK